MAINTIKYTSRTFSTVLNDINSDPDLRDTPESWKRLIAGSHDVLSMYNNAVANNTYLRTAFTRAVVTDLLALIDYFLTPKLTASGTVLFYMTPDTVILPKVFAAANLAARSQGTLAISSLRYEARASVAVSAVTETFITNFSADNNLTVARVYTTGEKVRLTSTTTLPAPLQPSTDYFVIYKTDTTIALATTLVNAYIGTEIVLSDNGTGTHSIHIYSFPVTVYQQNSIESFIIGQSDGATPWQKFNLTDLDVLQDTISIVINSVTWTRVETLIDSTSIDTHFILRYNTDNSSFIVFGNGEFGAIPGNFDIEAAYSIGGGINSNVTSVNRITSYAGSDSDIIAVSNPGSVSGGQDEEDIETAKILAPLLLKARDSFITALDGETLSNAYPGVSIAKVIKNAYGLLSANVLIVPDGGGAPATLLKNNLQNYLIARTILESIDVRVNDPNYISVTPVVQIKVLSGYLFLDVKLYVQLALNLIFSEYTQELYNKFLSQGIEAVTALINTKWSFSFGPLDYIQIQNLLGEVTPVYFGIEIQESDVTGILDREVFGVDYITISTPSFPVTMAADEIPAANVIAGNITEIV